MSNTLTSFKSDLIEHPKNWFDFCAATKVLEAKPGAYATGIPK